MPVAVDLRITGADKLGDLAKRLKAQGETGKGLRRDLLRELRVEAKPAAEAAKQAILGWDTKPPEDTGLRRKIAAGIKVRVRLTGRNPTVRISVGKIDGTNLPQRINKGAWRHPVFGTDTWVVQRGDTGWFDRTLRLQSRRVGRGVREVMARTAKKIVD